MTNLISQIVDMIRGTVTRRVSAEQGPRVEWRSVFHGPPTELLKPIFDALSVDGGITVVREGFSHLVPVLLQTDRNLPVNPAIGSSGECTTAHLLDLRNSPICPLFVALVAPGNHTSLSITSATGEFGLTGTNNSGNATIQQWWQDDFIQSLVETGISRLSLGNEKEIDQARKLIHQAVVAADEAERHDVYRAGAWRVFSRLFDIPLQVPSANFLSLACGVPPTEDSRLDAKEQLQVVARIGDFFEDLGFRTGVETLKVRNPELAEFLDQHGEHLREECNIPSTFARSPVFYYSPCRGESISDPPDWWKHLTLEEWIDLLEEERQPEGAFSIECINSIYPLLRGSHAVVRAGVELRIQAPDVTKEEIDAKLIRQAGGTSNCQDWDIKLTQELQYNDDNVPQHKAPVRYLVKSPNFKTASIKVVSLETWEPGIVIACRNARKISPPKKAPARKGKADYETSLVLEGSGRHYIDIYLASGVTPSATVKKVDEDDLSEAIDVEVSKVDETTWGFEADVETSCYYDLGFSKGEANKVIRIFLLCDDVAPEGSKTEFERLIKLNRQDRSRATSSVQIDRNVRCADLQTWLLDASNVGKSFYPLIISNDYDAAWRRPSWTERAQAIFSCAGFLHDPRPDVSDFRPPEEFIAARAAIAAKIRGTDESGLVESAKLGEWLANDEQFATAIESYLKSYIAWVDAEPQIALWVDTIALCGLEADNTSLKQEPDALILTPLHPIRLAWQALAQKTLLLSYRKKACPAASILDPDSAPDIFSLPLCTASGAISHQAFLAVECSSDYWGILWNGKKLDSLAAQADLPPFDEVFGLRIGGISSGFSLSQVRRALDDVCEMLSAKPEISVIVSRASGQTNACNEGIIGWCRDRLGKVVEGLPSMGPRMLQILDLRPEASRPEDAAISNLAEDTSNSVKWFAGDRPESSPDLGIIAQLEISNPREDPVDVCSPVGWGGLLRHRVRRQLAHGDGAFIAESRVGAPSPLCGDALADRLVSAIAKIENGGTERLGLLFAPSVPVIKQMLLRADFAVVSSSVIDPACFLGSWLPGYLWDYDLPSYSQRSGDTNGYYLLAKIKDSDREALSSNLRKLPEINPTEEQTDALILEVAQRGIPTVRGLSSGDHGASGDLGLLVASRLLQDAFRKSGVCGGLLPVLSEDSGTLSVSLIVPVDPFRGYIDDLQKAMGLPPTLRPDLVVVCINISPSEFRVKITPIEVKYRTSLMSTTASKEALSQASALSKLLNNLLNLGKDPELVIWRLAAQHLLSSMLSFAFRVYSQQKLAANQSKQWTEIHASVIGALFSGFAAIEIDPLGRLIIIDKTSVSTPRDLDGDSFQETLVLSPNDAAQIIREEQPSIYSHIISRLGNWSLLPSIEPLANEEGSPQHPPSEMPVRQQSTPETLTVTIEPLNPGTATTSEELSGEVTPPESIPTKGEEVSTHETEAFDSPEGINFSVGETVDGFKKEKLYFNPSNTDLNQLNIGVVGDLGTGKTQLLKTLIYQIVSSSLQNRGIRPRFLILDYKKDYCSPDFVDAVGARVIKPQHLPVNVFDRRHSKDALTPWLDRFNFFSDVLDKIYSGIGPVQRRQLKTAVKNAYDICGQDSEPTIYDIQDAYAVLLGDKPDSPSAILDDIVDREIFLRDPCDAVLLDNFLSGVVVLDLSSLGQDDRAKNMVVAIMLNVFYEQMMRIPKRPFLGNNPQLRAVDSFLLVDEADNIMRYEFDVLRKILLQGREFGVGVILASQYLRHFKAGANDYREPLLTWFIHKVPNITTNEIQALGMSAESSVIAERVKQLEKHCCLYKTVGVEGTIINGVPFYTLLK